MERIEAIITQTHIKVVVIDRMVYYKNKRIADWNRSMHIDEKCVLTANEHSINGMLSSVIEIEQIA
jgi:hypothetical protein